MALFKTDPDPQVAELVEKIEDLSKDLATLTGELEARGEQLKLTDKITDLKTQIEDLEIQKARRTEEHEREKRELKHMVGLEKKRQETEAELNKREVEIKVREENLLADRERFEEQMRFTHERFTGEVGYLKELMEQILLRLPTVEVTANGNGRARSKTVARK